MKALVCHTSQPYLDSILLRDVTKPGYSMLNQKFLLESVYEMLHNVLSAFSNFVNVYAGNRN